jgi:hypothetical protein
VRPVAKWWTWPGDAGRPLLQSYAYLGKVASLRAHYRCRLGDVRRLHETNDHRSFRTDLQNRK